MKPTVADSRTPNRLILRGPAGDLPPVTAEAAGSSPVVPAIPLNSLAGVAEKAWYTRRYTLSRTSCGRRHLSIPVPRQNHLHDPALSPALLAAYGMGVDVHGYVAVGVAHQ
jgi:hypothetical protein